MSFDQINLAAESIIEAKSQQLQALLDPIFSAFSDGKYKRGSASKVRKTAKSMDPEQKEAGLMAGFQMLGVPIRRT